MMMTYLCFGGTWCWYQWWLNKISLSIFINFWSIFMVIRIKIIISMTNILVDEGIHDNTLNVNLTLTMAKPSRKVVFSYQWWLKQYQNLNLSLTWDQWRLIYTELQSQQMAFTQTPWLYNNPKNFTIWLVQFITNLLIFALSFVPQSGTYVGKT